MSGAARSVALTGGATQVVSTGACWYSGLSVRETSGSAGAVIRVWDNPSAASGVLVATVALATGASRDVSIDGGPVYAAAGLFVERVSGAFEGAIRIT